MQLNEPWRRADKSAFDRMSPVFLFRCSVKSLRSSHGTMCSSNRVIFMHCTRKQTNPEFLRRHLGIIWLSRHHTFDVLHCGTSFGFAKWHMKQFKCHLKWCHDASLDILHIVLCVNNFTMSEQVLSSMINTNAYKADSVMDSAVQFLKSAQTTICYDGNQYTCKVSYHCFVLESYDKHARFKRVLSLTHLTNMHPFTKLWLCNLSDTYTV